MIFYDFQASHKQWRIQDFAGDCRQPLGAPTYYLTNFSRRLHKNELLAGGERPSRPLDPPLINFKVYHHTLNFQFKTQNLLIVLLLFKVYLHNAAWKPICRKFEVIASFSETLSFTNWLTDDEHVFPNTQYGLNQRELVISIKIVRYFCCSCNRSLLW